MDRSRDCQFYRIGCTVFLLLNVHFTAAHADVFSWQGGAQNPDTSPNSNLSEVDNWDVNGVPVSGVGTNSILTFNGGNVVVGGIFDVNVDLPAQNYNRMYITNGDFTISGNDLVLNPYAYTTANSTIDQPNVLINGSGNNTINTNITIVPFELDGQLGSSVTYDVAEIRVEADSLTLNGDISAANMDLRILGTGNSQTNLNGAVTADRAFSSVGDGSVVNINAGLTTDTLVTYGSHVISGADGNLQAAGISGQLGMLSGTVTLDNTTDAVADRIGDNVDVYLGSKAAYNSDDAATLELLGNAISSIEESAGKLVAGFASAAESGQSQYTRVPEVHIETAGQAATLVFDSFEYRNWAYDSTGGLIVTHDLNTGRIDFTTNDVFGQDAKVKFTNAPTLDFGLMQGATINSQEFASYDNTLGVVSATTSNDLTTAVGTDNVFVNANTALSANATVNSLAVAADITATAGTEVVSVTSGQLLLDGINSVEPRIDLGHTGNVVYIAGDNTLSGGISAAGDVIVTGDGVLTLGGASPSSINGNFDIANLGGVIVTADDALTGAAVSFNSLGVLDIGTTTQHVGSLNATGAVLGSGSVIATNNIAAYGNLDADLDAGGTISLNGTSSTVRNGDVTAADVSISYGTMNGNVTSTNAASLSSLTVNGVVGGAGDVILGGLSGSNLTAQNTYTGATSITGGYISYDRATTLSGNGGILNSSGITIDQYRRLRLDNVSGDESVDRIGDSVAIDFADNASTLAGILEIRATGGGTNVNIDEDIGAISVAAEQGIISILNSTGGTTTVTADSLSASAGSTLLLEIDANSKLFFDAAPATVGTTSILQDAAIEKTVGADSMYTWATYDNTDGAREAVLTAATLTGATSDDFIRVTNATNSDLNGNVTAAAVLIDTFEVGGTGTLSLATGQLAFYKNANVSIDTIDFGSNQGVLNNVGNSTISSTLTGTGGMLKTGDGSIRLTGNSTYTGDTYVERGVLEIAGNLPSRVVNYGGTIRLVGPTSQVGEVSGRMELLNKALSVTDNRFAGANIVIGASSSLSNSGTVQSAVIEQGRFATNSTTGSIQDVNVDDGSYVNNGYTGFLDVYNGSATNAGTIGSAAVLGNASATLFNYASGTITNLVQVNNLSTVENRGTIESLLGRNDGTIINRGSLDVLSNRTVSGNGLIQQLSGVTTVNGAVYNDMDIQGGTLKGAGYVFGDLSLAAGATFQPGNSPGLFTVEGDFNVATGANIVLEIVSDGAGGFLFDEIAVAGAFNVQGDIEFSLGAGLDASLFIAADANTPAEFSVNEFFLDNTGDVLELASLVGTNIQIGDENGDYHEIVLADDGQGGISADVAAVPVPAAVWLFSSGLVLIAGFRRRRSIHDIS